MLDPTTAVIFVTSFYHRFRWHILERVWKIIPANCTLHFAVYLTESIFQTRSSPKQVGPKPSNAISPSNFNIRSALLSHYLFRNTNLSAPPYY